MSPIRRPNGMDKIHRRTNRNIPNPKKRQPLHSLKAIPPFSPYKLQPTPPASYAGPCSMSPKNFPHRVPLKYGVMRREDKGRDEGWRGETGTDGHGRAYASNYVHRFTRKWENFRGGRSSGAYLVGQPSSAGGGRRGGQKMGGKGGLERVTGMVLVQVAFVVTLVWPGTARSFAAWLTICPPRTAFGTEYCTATKPPPNPPPPPRRLGYRHGVYYLN